MCDATEVGSQSWNIDFIFIGAEALPVLLMQVRVVTGLSLCLSSRKEEESEKDMRLPMRMAPTNHNGHFQ